jgi:DNA modification methylase
MKIHCLYDELLPVKELRRNPKNPNIHSKEQIERLAKILEYQGWRYAIKVSRQSGFITSGHGRLEAAIHLGQSNVPVVFQDYDNDEQEYADIVADNSIASWAELDLANINTEIGNLGPDFDIDLLGIKDFTLDMSDKLEPGCDEDEIPEKVEPKAKIGDIYRLGNHRLMCGDSTNVDAVEKLMGGIKIDMIFTDPPYGLGDKKSFNKDHKDFEDRESFDLRLLQLWDCEYVVWGGNYYDWIPSPRTQIGWIVWDKRPSRESWDTETRASADRRFGQHFEIAITNLSEVRGKMIRKTWGGFYGTAGDPTNSIVHKTQKPIELLDVCLQPRHNTVLDYFGGSGSTLIACEKTNRKCFMMEIDPHYIDIIIARWEKYTGKKAELINNG